MNIKEYTDFIRISGAQIDFDATFFSGQCFRWRKMDDFYIGIVDEKIIFIKPQDEYTFDIYNCSPDEFKKSLYWYFDLDKDYDQILDRLSKHDIILREAVEKYRGMRLLNQEPFECMISFIISQNNNIKRIQLLIERLCQTFGKKITYKGYVAWSFPAEDSLFNASIDDFKQLGLGYRAEYIKDAVEKIKNGTVNLNELVDLDVQEARQVLKSIKGIGDKVADCILLYSLQKYNIFPIDRWVRRVLKEFYRLETKEQIKNFIESFGDLAGYAQLFLFHYIRNNYKN
ncbi:DNA-3-methyladenine glycosylase family protein [Caldicellulosiruptor morganii]|uniref:DNA-(apurinic or apyrimidinic site) lyase n=1 Tax=Caldicellulosiruptor morganii TaxID=1387555 RepID=A0ABY7BL00_9FIRM|nr:DNA glycosylase [Caldicellulosiruptor morganii]WAM33170.1 DNA-3-methyladenine glycosylase 2 family protein [Caldicellulosiruptor morganii]